MYIMHKIHGVTLSIPSIALHGKTVYYKAIKGKHPNGQPDRAERTNTMKKIIACICIALAAFTAGHFATLYTLEIETDGDGDSAIVTSFGQEHFYGINGYEIG